MTNADYHYALDHQYDDDGFATCIVVWRFKDKVLRDKQVEDNYHTWSPVSVRHHLVDGLCWAVDHGATAWVQSQGIDAQWAGTGTYDSNFT